MSKGLEKAVQHYGGNQSALARALGVTSMTICNWFSRGVPAERAVQIEEVTNGGVTREEIRPDLFVRNSDSAA